MSTETQRSGGIGFFGLLTICFIFLKLTGFINWSWWWVLAPIWAMPLIVIALVFVWAIIVAAVRPS